jgi:mono/diheme cytochrome c family protein
MRDGNVERARAIYAFIDEEYAMKRIGLAMLGALAAIASGCGGDGGPDDAAGPTAQAARGASLVAQGRQIFRFETFGDEAKWTDALRLHEVIAAQVDPLTALNVGLKVDADALPQSLKDAIQAGTVDLASPDTTLALLKLDAVVGLKGRVDTEGGVAKLKRVGITCALCHSTVDDSFMPGIGKRLDGWPNRDLNVGAIIALSPAVDAAEKQLLNGWGRGMYDPRHNIDGLNKPVVIAPAYGLAGIHKITFTGDGDEIQYWNRYVAVTQMGGLGTFTDQRLPLTVTNGNVDLVSDKLPALQAYQLSLAAPAAPAGSFDTQAAARGKVVFDGKGRCATCHTGEHFTDANSLLHPPADSVVEPEVPSYAARSATKMYRTTPLKGIWQHPPYFHDGSAATLQDVGRAYNSKLGLGLTDQQIADLAQYLKSL